MKTSSPSRWNAALIAAALCSLCAAGAPSADQDTAGVVGSGGGGGGSTTTNRIGISDGLRKQLTQEPALRLDQELHGRQLYAGSSNRSSHGRGYVPRSAEGLAKLRGDLVELHESLRGNFTSVHIGLTLANQLRKRASGESEFSGRGKMWQQRQPPQRASDADPAPRAAANSTDGRAAVAGARSSPRLRGGIVASDGGHGGDGAARVADDAASAHDVLTAAELTAQAVPYGDDCCFDYPALDPPSHPRHRPGLCYVSDKFKFVFLLVRGWVGGLFVRVVCLACLLLACSLARGFVFVRACVRACVLDFFCVCACFVLLARACACSVCL
jgi:hypothetical protein